MGKLMPELKKVTQIKSVSVSILQLMCKFQEDRSKIRKTHTLFFIICSSTT